MQNSTSPVATPTLKRRLICLVYEAFLVTAVVMLGMFVFLFIAQLIDPDMNRPFVYYGRTIVLFGVAGAYFLTCWMGSGHTLAMKTWRIKLVKVGYAQVPLKAAFWRYVFAWGWVLPALLVCFICGFHGKAQIAGALALGIIAWGLTAFLDKDRQFLHDKLAGTRLISLPKPQKTVAAVKSA
jgi:uncharacterized RDD family membrane protein YckC